MNARRLCAIALIAFAVTLAACGGDDDSAVRVIVDGTVQPTPAGIVTAVATVSPTPEPVPFTPTPPPSTIDPDDIRGFLWPVAGACLPDRGALMPNSPREYRSGKHEGIDWYDLSSCARVAEGTAIVAMFDGVVVRADTEYEGLSARTLAALEARVTECACSEPEVLDAFRGMQVWIDHGNGVLTRYAHLGSIDEAAYVGAEVRRGQRRSRCANPARRCTSTQKSASTRASSGRACRLRRCGRSTSGRSRRSRSRGVPACAVSCARAGSAREPFSTMTGRSRLALS